MNSSGFKIEMIQIKKSVGETFYSVKAPLSLVGVHEGEPRASTWAFNISWSKVLCW